MCACSGNVLAANEALYVIDRPERVSRSLVLCSISDEALVVRKSHVGRCDPVSLVIGNDLYTSSLVHTHARVPAHV